MDPCARAVVASVEDPTRFGEIFDRHHRVIWRYLARTVGTDRADDLTGDVFAAAFGARDRFDPTRGQVRAWLYGIAANHVRVANRSDGRARRAFGRVAAERSAADEVSAVAEVSAVDEADWHADRIKRVRAAMLTLPEDELETLTLVVWEELSYREVAAALDIPIGTVRSRIARARTRLRDLVDHDLEPVTRKGTPSS